MSSINKGQLSKVLAASTNLRNSDSVMSPRLICSEETSAASDRTLAASCSEDISNEKKPTQPPLMVPSDPSGNSPFL